MTAIEYARHIQVMPQAVFAATSSGKIPFTRDEKGCVQINPLHINQDHLIAILEIQQELHALSAVDAVDQTPVMLEEEIYPENIMSAVRQNLDVEEDDTSRDDEIACMSKKEVLSRVLEWEGICGYTDDIFQWILDIYGIDLNEMTYMGQDLVKLEGYDE